MIGGQVVDVQSSGHAIDQDRLDFIYELKTGALLEAAMMVGAVLAGLGKGTLFQKRSLPPISLLF